MIVKVSSQFARLAAPFLVAMVPLLPFLLPSWGNSAHSPGWTASLETIQYFSRSIEATGNAPAVFHKKEGVGFPHPLFQEPMLYPILGITATKFGPLTSVFLFAYFIMFICFVGMRACLRPLAPRKWEAAIAALIVWLIFPSILFYDGRFAEAGAIALLFTGLAYWWLFARNPRDPYGKACAACSWLCFALMAGIYPEGARIYIALFGVVLGVSAVFPRNRHQVLMGAIGMGVGVLAVASPSIYTYLHFRVFRAPAGEARFDPNRFQIHSGFSGALHPEWEGLPPVKAEFQTTDPDHIPALKLQLPQSSLIKTNVVAFPWNRVRIERHLLELENAVVSGGRVTFALPAGSHLIEYAFVPSAEWVFLKKVSLAAFITGLFLLWFLSVRAALARIS
jgi:hypothetical protein